MWFRELAKNGGEKLSLFLVGTKSDLAKANRSIKKDYAQKFAKERNFVAYHETSAKEGHGFFDLFSDVKECLENL